MRGPIPQCTMRKKGDCIRLLIVEDHEVVRVALRVLLDRTGDIHVVDEAGTAAVALKQVVKYRPDVVLLDVSLPDRSGLELFRDIRVAFPGTGVLFLTARPDIETLRSSMVGGAHGYLHKTTNLESLVEAIKAVATGQSYPAAKSVMSGLRSPPASSEAGRILQLSPQERKVIALTADGKTNKEIGAALALSEKTVKNYISHAFDKLQVTRRAQAAAMFVRTLSNTTTLLN